MGSRDTPKGLVVKCDEINYTQKSKKLCTHATNMIFLQKIANVLYHQIPEPWNTLVFKLWFKREKKNLLGKCYCNNYTINLSISEITNLSVYKLSRKETTEGEGKGRKVKPVFRRIRGKGRGELTKSNLH